MSLQCKNRQTIDAAVTWQQWCGSIHELEPRQIDLFCSHLLRLDNDCRRSRFGHPTSNAFLEQYAARLGAANTRVFGCAVDGHVRGAVELRSLRSEWSTDAELAFSVETCWQGRGIGTALMARAIKGARGLYILHLHLSCHRFNRPMQRIVYRFAASIGFYDGECLAGIVVRSEPASAALTEQPESAPLCDRIFTLDLGPPAGS